MAPADAGDFLLDQDDDDFFGEYNPHPYQGGYDLAATFGTPLPPSANICYPVSSSSFPAAAAPITPSPPTPTPEPADPPPVERDEKAPPREPVRESPEVFPNGAVTERKVRKGGWRRRFLKKCVRALDYIFGYKDPYAEQRIGVDNYVVPVYANRKESGDDALAVEVEVPPPSVGRVEPHDGSEELVQSNDLPWHSNYRNDADTYSLSMSYPYYMPSFAQYYGLPGVLGKPDWFPNSSYSESHQVEEFQHEALLSYNVEHMTSGQPIHCYHHHHCEQPLNVQVEPPEPVSSQSIFQHIVTKVVPTFWKLQLMHTTFSPIHQSLMCHLNLLGHHGLRIGAFMMPICNGMLLKTIHIL